MLNIAIEYVTFKLNPNISQEEYLNKYQKVFTNYLSQNPDFISLEHVYNLETNEYGNWVKWKTMEAAQQAAQEIMTIACAIEWFSLMDQKSIKMQHFISLN